MQEEVKQGNGKKWFFGCCGGLVLLMLLTGGGLFYGAHWVKDQAPRFLRENMGELLRNSELSEQESNEITNQLDRLGAAIDSWGLLETFQHIGNLETVAPEIQLLVSHGMLLGYSQGILPRTPISEEERESGRRTLQRFSRGLDEGELFLNQQDENWELKGHDNGSGEVEFDAARVRAHLASLKAQVDAAGIPDEPYEVELAERLTTIVDAMLAE
ncbi:MAG: hypothetical protein KDB61_04705 [Planctomycetes bacterium]|nr:hypothetical protein [Planctomycetota bacterium]